MKGEAVAILLFAFILVVLLVSAAVQGSGFRAFRDRCEADGGVAIKTSNGNAGICVQREAVIDRWEVGGE